MWLALTIFGMSLHSMDQSVWKCCCQSQGRNLGLRSQCAKNEEAQTRCLPPAPWDRRALRYSMPVNYPVSLYNAGLAKERPEGKTLKGVVVRCKLPSLCCVSKVPWQVRTRSCLSGDARHMVLEGRISSVLETPRYLRNWKSGVLSFSIQSRRVICQFHLHADSKENGHYGSKREDFRSRIWINRRQERHLRQMREWLSVKMLPISKFHVAIHRLDVTMHVTENWRLGEGTAMGILWKL